MKKNKKTITKTNTIKKEHPKITLSMKKFIETASSMGLGYSLEFHNWDNEKLNKLLRENTAFSNAYHKEMGLKPIQVKFLSVFKKRLCNISKTCDVLGLNRATYYDWLDNYPAFKTSALALKASLADDLETVMFDRALSDKSDTMLIWLSKVHLKDRGYVERIEQKEVENPFFELMKKASKVENE